MLRFSGIGGGSPSQADVSSFSSSKVTVLEMISQGECEGLLKGEESIFLDNTPVKNADGTYNFKGIKIAWRNGAGNQTYMPEFADMVANTTETNAEVKNSVPVVKIIRSQNIDGIRIKLSFVLQKIKDDGGTEKNTLPFSIYIKQGTGAFELVHQETKNAYFPSATEFDFFFPIDSQNGEVTDFQIKITKDTADAAPDDANKDIKILTLKSYAEALQEKLSYPYSALVGIQMDSKYFSSPPARSYEFGGYLCLVPSNSTVTDDGGLDFNGSWDGTFYRPLKAISDPAWHLFSLLTDKNWGLGEYIDEKFIDKWGLYSVSQYNNSYVPDGFGGQERRYLCDTVITGKNDAWNLINSICSSMAVKPFWNGLTVSFWQDRPTDTIAQFTQADLKEETYFTYSSTPLRGRKSVVNIQYTEPINKFKLFPIRVEDQDSIARYGIRETDIVAYGCTRQGQAVRIARNALVSDRIQTETVTFTARAIALGIQPGTVFTIADEARAGVRYGGITKGGTTTSVIIDYPVDITSGRISVMLESGAIETKDILSINNFVVTINGLFSENPAIEGNWVLVSDEVSLQEFRCISNVRNSTDPNYCDITAITYRGDKYDFIENNLQLTRQTLKTVIPVIVSKPTNLTIALTATELRTQWDAPAVNSEYITGYYVQYAVGDGEYLDNSLAFTESLHMEFPVLTNTEKYTFRVRSFQVDGKTSEWAVYEAENNTLELDLGNSSALIDL